MTKIRYFTSLDIAHDIKREHRKVMSDIKSLIQMMEVSNYDGQEWFEKTTYRKEKGSTYEPIYLLTQEGINFYYERIKAAQKLE